MSILKVDITREGHSQYRPRFIFGGLEVWRDKASYPTDEEAVEGAIYKAAKAFEELFQLIDNEVMYNPTLQILDALSAKDIEQEALNRETMGGPSFAENFLLIVQERCHAA
jgi:hypothetical protein